MVYAIIAVGALGGLGQPALQSVMTRRVPANAHGELQGAVTSLQGLSMVLGPQIMPRVFKFFSSEEAPVYMPGASFILAGALTLVALVIALKARRRDGATSSSE